MSMGLLTISMSKVREELLTILQERPDYMRMTKADIIETGLRHLVHQENKTVSDEKKFPDFLKEKEWLEFYSKPMKKEAYKEIDNFMNFLMRLHNEKYARDEWE